MAPLGRDPFGQLGLLDDDSAAFDIRCRRSRRAEAFCQPATLIPAPLLDDRPRPTPDIAWGRWLVQHSFGRVLAVGTAFAFRDSVCLVRGRPLALRSRLSITASVVWEVAGCSADPRPELR
jgi:hypothetical protein